MRTFTLTWIVCCCGFASAVVGSSAHAISTANRRHGSLKKRRFMLLCTLHSFSGAFWKRARLRTPKAGGTETRRTITTKFLFCGVLLAEWARRGDAKKAISLKQRIDGRKMKPAMQNQGGRLVCGAKKSFFRDFGFLQLILMRKHFKMEP